MQTFERDRRETGTATPVEDRRALTGEVDAEGATGPAIASELPAGAAARMLELAGITADRLVTDAQTEAESLVSVAQGRADAILEATRAESHQVAAELARTKGGACRGTRPPARHDTGRASR